MSEESTNPVIESTLSDVFSVITDAENSSWAKSEHLTQYLQEISNCGFKAFLKEPDRLLEEKAAVVEQTQELAFQNYKTFVQTAQCSTDIVDQFKVIHDRTSSLEQKLPEFVDRTRTFNADAHSIISRWHRTSQTLSKHPQLLEILEIPQLMETCVHGGHYDDALELAAYVKRLEKKYGNVKLIASIAKQVNDCRERMLNHLLHQLRFSIQLPQCLKIVAYLRRVSSFGEMELKQKFLDARGVWFKSILDKIPRNDVYTHTTRTLEAYRVHLFDIVTQYRAIFPLGLEETQGGRLGARVDVSSRMIFDVWLQQQISVFLATLESSLMSGYTEGRLDAVLSQCMYFGLSFSRVGCDFRALMVPLFVDTVWRRTEFLVRDAGVSFVDALRSTSLSNITSGMGGATLMTTSMNSVSTDSLAPPLGLMEFPLLARFCNALVATFNELRFCCPLTLVTKVTRILETVLLDATTAIAAVYELEKATLGEAEDNAVRRMSTVFANDYLSYLDACLELLFPASSVAQLLAIPLNSVGRVARIHLDRGKIVAPIEYLVETPPALEEHPEVEVVEVTEETDTAVVQENQLKEMEE